MTLWSSKMKLLILLVLSSLMLFAESDFSQKIERLSQTSEWLRLLHFKNNKSEIDDDRFFFSKDGKSDAKAELRASIEQLMVDKSDDENSTFCRYPARSYWILKNFSSLKKNYIYLNANV